MQFKIFSTTSPEKRHEDLFGGKLDQVICRGYGHFSHISIFSIDEANLKVMTLMSKTS